MTLVGFRRVLCFLVVFPLFLCLSAAAATANTVYIPLTFHGEEKDLQSGACLQIRERVYSTEAPWRNFGPTSDSAERAFESLITAIRQKNPEALLKTVAPASRSSIKYYDQEARELFTQFEAVPFVTVVRAYEFDGLVAFFAQFHATGKTIYAPMVFARESNGAFGYVPYRSKAIALTLVKDWFDAVWGPSGTEHPSYCSEAQITTATHKFPLASAVGAGQRWQQSVLFLHGASLDKPGRLGPVVARVNLFMSSLRTALLSDQINKIAVNLTSHGASRLRDWFATASAAERETYIRSILDQRPFFVFDLSTVLVVYTKSSTNVVQVIYLASGQEQEQLLWTNSSTITSTDAVFKHGVLFEAAASKIPFAAGEMK